VDVDRFRATQPDARGAAAAPRFVLWPEEIDVAPGAFGGKAGALARLRSAGVEIPPWFVLAPAAFEASLTPERWTALRGGEGVGIADDLANLEVDAQVRRALEVALERIRSGTGRVAVRSSAGDEDGAQHSFAGQFESFLHVEPHQVPARVADVWRSAFAERVLTYRHEAGLPPLPRAPAVLIQRMVEPEVSGVAFSADPVSGRRSVALVSAVYGLGSALVSGEADADSHSVARNGAILARSIADKVSAHRFDPEAPERVAAVPVREGLRLLPALGDEDAVRVAELARRTARHFGRPQDIEWALEGEGLYLLQSRPITSLAGLADPDGELRIWDNSNIVESYGGVTTPLTFSFARHAFEGVYRNLCRILGFSEAKLNAHTDTFRNMLGLVRGRIYYNLLSWYRILAALPGYQSNRDFMEQMMGVREGLPPEVAADLTPSTWRSRARDRVEFSVSLTKLVVSLLTLPRSVRRFYRRLRRALAEPEVPLERMRSDELVRHYRDLERELLRGWDAPLVNDFFAMIFYGLLRRLGERWCGDEDGTLQNDLLAGEGGMISAEPAARVRELAAIAAERPEVVRLFTGGDRVAIAAAVADFPAFERPFRSYLDAFGERCMEELKLESPTLTDDPLPLLRAVGLLARHPPSEAAIGDNAQGARLRAEARASEVLRDPLRRRLFAFVLRQARDRVRDRENLRFERTRLFGRVRSIFVELGRRLAARDLLDRPRDIFYLEIDEILGFVEGTATSVRIRELAALRRAEYDGYREAEALPDRFETRGAVFAGNRFEALREPAVAPEGDTLRGIGCCPGVVRGRVRIVGDPYRAELDQGDILVADHTDPGWIILFPSAAGLLVERGSLLSHAAIVSRELGLPAVVSLPGLLGWLRDGDLVEFDGSSGLVRRLEPAEAATPHGQGAVGAE
jgi:pyruvate,water dikinase